MITTVTQEMQTRARTGFNYWTVPGREDPMRYKPETLDECIKRIFGVDEIDLPEKPSRKGRQGGAVYARHLKRYVLERVTKDNQITERPRTSLCSYLFKYPLDDIAPYCKCTKASISQSSDAAKDLMRTDKDYMIRVEQLLNKIKLNLIKFPEL